MPILLRVEDYQTGEEIIEVIRDRELQNPYKDLNLILSHGKEGLENQINNLQRRRI